jgi:hypothetical protein
MSNDNLQLTINTLINQREKLLKKITSLDEAITILRGEVSSEPVFVSNESNPSTIVPTTPADYDVKSSINSKVKYILKEKNRFMRFREIAEIMAIYDRKTHISISDLANKISNACANLKQNSEIVKIRPDNKNINSYWGSPKWLNPDGSIKAGHEIDPSSMVIKNKTNIEI